MIEDTEITSNEELDSKEITIVHRGKNRVFVVREIPYGMVQKFTSGLNHQDDAKKAKAFADYGCLMISAGVTENGKKLTFDQASNLPSKMGKRLEKEVTEMNDVLGKAAEEEAKKE